MKKTYIILLSLIIITLTQCKWYNQWHDDNFADEELIFSREDYTGKEIKTEDYYFETNEFEGNKDQTSVILFNKNGIVTGNPSIIYEISEMPMLETKFANGEWYEMISKKKDYWGIFFIHANFLKVETGGYNENGAFKTYFDEYKIINDTTLKSLRYYKIKEGEGVDEYIYNYEKLWHFKKFSPKPDSTCSFID